MKKENRQLGNRKVSPRASLDIIPDVVLLRVFCLLDDIDLYVISLCTTRMRHLTYSDVIWNGKYKQRFYSSPSTCNWQGLNYVQEYYRLSATRTLRTSIKSIELCKARKISTLSGVCHLRLLGNRILVSFADGAMKSIVVEDGTEESIVNVCDDLERIQSEREKEKLRGDLVAAHKNALFAFKLRKFGRSDEIDLWSASESHECTKVVEPISPVSAFAQSSESASQEGESQESETLTPQTSPMLSSSKTRLTSRKGSKKSRRRSSARTRLPVGGLEVLRKTSMNTHGTIDAKVIKDGTMSSVSMSSNSVLSAIVTGDGEQFDDFKSPKFVDQIDVTPSDVPKDDVAKTRQGVCVNSMRELNLCDSDSPSSSDSHYGSDSDCSSTGTSQSSEASSPLHRTTRFAIVSSKRTTRSSSSNKRRRNRHRVPIMPVVVTQNAQQIAHRKKFMEHLSRQSNNCDENIMGVAVAHKSIVIVRYGVKSKSKNNHLDLKNTTKVTNQEKQGTFVKRRNRSGIEKNLSVGSKGKRVTTDGNKNTAPEIVMDISVDSELLAPTWMTTRDVPVSAIAMTSCIAEKASKTTGKAEDCEISVLTGHTDGSVRTWSSDGTFLSEWKASTGAIIAISVAPSQVTVLISSAEGELSTWDIVSCRKLANMRTNPAGSSRPRNDISAASHSTTYTNRTGSSRPRNDIPTDSLLTTCIQIDSEIVVAGWIDGSVGIWNRKGSQLHHQRTESSACTCTFMIGQPQELKNSVELSHMRHTSIVNFALGHSSGNVTVWRGNTEVGIEGNFDSIILSGHIAQVRQVHMDMHKVVSCGDDGAIKIWGIESTEQGTNASLIRTLRWRGGRSPIVCLAVGPSIIVGGALDGSVQAFAIGNPSKKLSSWAEKFRELNRDGSSTEKAKSQNTSGGRASGRVRQKTSRGSASKRRMKTGLLAYDLTSEYDDDYAMDYSTRQHEFY